MSVSNSTQYPNSNHVVASGGGGGGGGGGIGNLGNHINANAFIKTSTFVSTGTNLHYSNAELEYLLCGSMFEAKALLHNMSQDDMDRWGMGSPSPISDPKTINVNSCTKLYLGGSWHKRRDRKVVESVVILLMERGVEVQLMSMPMPIGLYTPLIRSEPESEDLDTEIDISKIDLSKLLDHLNQPIQPPPGGFKSEPWHINAPHVYGWGTNTSDTLGSIHQNFTAA